MFGFTLSSEIKLGDLSIIVSAFVFIYTIIENRRFKRQEYAERIRKAGGTIISKLDRYQELTLRFFQDIQPLITEMDIQLVKEKDIVRTRDALWIGLTEARAKASQRIIDEQIEMAYVDLYGYDYRVKELFTNAIRELNTIDAIVHKEFLVLTQENVLRMENRTDNIKSGELGNLLHRTCEIVSSDCINRMNEVLSYFKKEMNKLIEAPDKDIVKRNIKIEGWKFSSSIEEAPSSELEGTIVFPNDFG
jgi:hypothetical protein